MKEINSLTYASFLTHDGLRT